MQYILWQRNKMGDFIAFAVVAVEAAAATKNSEQKFI